MKNSQHIAETEGSWPYSQEPATSLYPKPDESGPYHSILFLKCIVILSSHLRFCLSSVSFPSGFPIETLYSGLYSFMDVTCWKIIHSYVGYSCNMSWNYSYKYEVLQIFVEVELNGF